MTNREFFVAIIGSADNEEIKAKAQAMLDQLDKENEKRRSTPTKAQKENEPLKVKILAFIATGRFTASEVGAKLAISSQKASALCRQLVEAGQAVSVEVKTKNGKVKAYSAIA